MSAGPERITPKAFLDRLTRTSPEVATILKPREEFQRLEALPTADPVTFLYDWAALRRVGVNPFLGDLSEEPTQTTKDNMTDSTPLNIETPQNEVALEATIIAKGLTAPRLTPDYINSRIVSKTFHVFPDTLHTICQLRLVNGFTVTGENACASPANWDRDIGESESFKNARNKIWELEGYLLKQRLFDQSQFRTVEEIARVCHEANRAYCVAMGDHSHKPWEECGEAQKKTMILGVEFRLNNPNSGPEASHESWMEQKTKDGWTYGPEKDTAMRRHPCYRPFNELPVANQAQDSIFAAIVKSMAK